MATENTELYLPIMLTLIPQDTTSTALKRKRAPAFDWRFIGRDVYCRSKHGVFKLAIWDGGCHDGFVGLYGTYVAHQGGKVDLIYFRFNDLLEPNYAKCTNPNVVKGRDRLSIYCREREVWSWYCGLEPVSLKPLHDAIVQWMQIWNEQ